MLRSTLLSASSAPERLHQLLARLDPPGSLGEQQQDVELAAGQLAPHAADAHLARAAIDGQALEAQRLGARRRRPPRAPQDRAQARQHLARVERLRQVIVGAELQPHDAVQVVAARGQHQHRHVGLRADAAADLEPVHVGQHHVQDHRAHVARLQRRQPGSTVGALLDRETARHEIATQHRGQPLVVVDDQDPVDHGWVRNPLSGHEEDVS